MRIRLKKVRTKCMVKGCRNSGNKVKTYNVSASHEFGKGVIMCEACMKDTYEALMEVQNAEHRAHSGDDDNPSDLPRESQLPSNKGYNEEAEPSEKPKTKRAAKKAEA